MSCLKRKVLRSPTKKLKPPEDSSKKLKINLVKVAGEDLYHVDEKLSPVAEEEWEEEGEEESEEDELNGHECLWRDGEHEPKEDPEGWIDRVADEVEEKRFQEMQVLERPEGSAEGISYLTTRNVCLEKENLSPWGWNNKQEAEEKIKTSCKRTCFG